MARILGIDVSHHQAELDWHRVVDGGVSFCFVQATEGTSWVDGRFEQNWQRSQDVGLYRGAYHFARVGADAATQAVHFHSVVGSPGFLDLPPVLALEESNGHTPEQVLRWTREFLLEAAELFDLRDVGYDPWNASQLVVELEQEGVEMVTVRQGFATMSPPTKALLQMVLELRLRHGGDPVLRWCASNVAALYDPAGNVKPDKSRSAHRIDPIVALIIAIDGYMRRGRELKRESVYKRRALVVA